MSKTKMHKAELAKSRTTEDAAEESIINQQVELWVVKLRLAERSAESTNAKVDAVANVLGELVDEIVAGKVAEEVIMGVARRGNWVLSLTRLIEKRGKEWQGKGLLKG